MQELIVIQKQDSKFLKNVITKKKAFTIWNENFKKDRHNPLIYFNKL